MDETHVEEEDWLVTIDVKSLYTSIPHDRGIETACRYLDIYYDRPRLTETMRCLMGHILRDNVFQFEGEYFAQVKGTAMGTKMAPAYMHAYLWPEWKKTS